MILLICALFKNTGCLIHSLICLFFSPQFCSIGVSGIDDTLILGRPFGGCGILYRKTLSDRVAPVICMSKRCCAILLTAGVLSVLCVCVYFPTNYHDAQSTDVFIDRLGEIEGLLDSVSFDHLIIGGDFNVDLGVSSPRATLFSDFLQDRGLICVDKLPISSITHTYHCDSTGASSWIDHFVRDSGLASFALSVSTVELGSNFSDHLPNCIQH